MQIDIQYHLSPSFYPRVRNRRKPICVTLLARLVAALGKARSSVSAVKPVRGEI